jgi:hypothetical protein
MLPPNALNEKLNRLKAFAGRNNVIHDENSFACEQIAVLMAEIKALLFLRCD